MTTQSEGAAFLKKADDSLVGAASEFANGRYNNCANRCYYACFQAAVAALTRAGIRLPGQGGRWSHAFVPAQFDGQLINRRKLYPSDLRGLLARSYALRQKADYGDDVVSRTEAERTLRRAETFVRTVQRRGGEPP